MTWNLKWHEFSYDMKSQMTWNLKWHKISNDMKSQVTWNLKWHEISNDMTSQMTWNLNWLETSNDMKSQMTWNNGCTCWLYLAEQWTVNTHVDTFWALCFGHWKCHFWYPQNRQNCAQKWFFIFWFYYFCCIFCLFVFICIPWYSVFCVCILYFVFCILHLIGLRQAGTTCGASSQPDLIQNHFLITRMLTFLRHSPYFNISRQKVTHFNVLCQKVKFLMFCNKEREIQRWNILPLSHSVSRSISSFSFHFCILCPVPHSLSISSFSVHFLILSPFPLQPWVETRENVFVFVYFCILHLIGSTL